MIHDDDLKLDFGIDWLNRQWKGIWKKVCRDHSWDNCLEIINIMIIGSLLNKV